RRGGLAQLLPFIAKKRLVFILTVLSGIVAQLANVTALGTGAWLVGQALTGGAPQHLIGGIWLLGGAVIAAAACKYFQTFISHDFAFALLEALGGLNAEVVEGVQGLRELAMFGAGRSFLARLMRDTRAVHAIQLRYG